MNRKYADVFLMSLVKHDPDLLPLSPRYRATENGIPAALCNMSCYRTISEIKSIGHIISDRRAGQVVITAEADEGNATSALVARLKIDAELITELEIFLIRSRAQAGFWFAPQDTGKHEGSWATPMVAEKKASYEELEFFARALYDPNIEYNCSAPADCVMMEDGGIVYEHVEYAAALMPNFDPSMVPAGQTRISMPMGGMNPNRPADPDARIVCIDDTQGIVVSIALVHGYVSPYLVSDETSSCFVPESMIKLHHSTLRDELFTGRHTMIEAPVSCFCITINKLYDGMMYGHHQYTSLYPTGGRSVWSIDN